jgi:hypothetical protein
MRQTLHDMATRHARMQTIIDRYPEVTSAAAQSAPRAPIRPVAERLSQPQPHGPPRPSGHSFGGPAFRPFTQAAASQGGHSGDIPRAHSYLPPLPPGPPPPSTVYAAPPRPAPVHTRLGPRPVPQGDPFLGSAEPSWLWPPASCCPTCRFASDPGTLMLLPSMLHRPLPSTVAVRVLLPVTWDPLIDPKINCLTKINYHVRARSGRPKIDGSVPRNCRAGWS